MKTRSFERNFRFFCCLVLVGAGFVSAALPGESAEQPPLNKYGVRSWDQNVAEQIVVDGKLIDGVVVPPCPPPENFRGEAVEVPASNIALGTNSISDMPAFDWCYGCSATSAGMAMGHYDRTGYPNMYAGPANGGFCPLDNSIWGPATTYPGPPSAVCGHCPLVVTEMGKDDRLIKGHVDDYWISYGNASDPYIIGGWAKHANGDCTGDYMGTNQSALGSTDGSTWFYYYNNGNPLYDNTACEPARKDGCHGMREFVESRGYTVVTNFSQYRQGKPGTDADKGFTFANFQAEIDAGNPVLIQLDGHTMLGYGYNTTGSLVYIHDTWDYLDHSMTWGGSYGTPLMAHLGVTVIQISGAGPVLPTPTPEPPTPTPEPPPPCPIRAYPDRTSFSGRSDQMYIHADADVISTWCYPFVRVVTPYYGTFYLTARKRMYRFPVPYVPYAIKITGPIRGLYLTGLWWRNIKPGTYYLESGAVDAGSGYYLGSVYTTAFTLN